MDIIPINAEVEQNRMPRPWRRDVDVDSEVGSDVASTYFVTTASVAVTSSSSYGSSATPLTTISALIWGCSSVTAIAAKGSRVTRASKTEEG
jgi:hypothetical protein